VAKAKVVKLRPVGRPLRIGLVGCGVVGGGVAEALLSPDKPWDRGAEGPLLELVKVADIRFPESARLGNGLVIPKSMRCRSADELLADPDIDVIVETVGGTTFARQVIERALEAGKDVVTANKALLAEHGGHLFKKASRLGREIAFEAAVAGGIPILSAIRGGLAANDITTIYGILNGTTNFILTRMTETGASFESALREAQQLGYAEADPTLDVEGVDAAHKIHLLAALALGREIPMRKIPVQGIRHVSALDIAYARQLGCRIKLLAAARLLDGGLEISVSPSLINESHPLASVANELNAVFTEGSLVGRTLFVGRGAGRYPTASAVIADLIELHAGDTRRYVQRMLEARIENPVSPEKSVSGYYLRISAAEKPGVLSRVTGVLGRAGISIASCVQLEKHDTDAPVPVALLTHTTTAARLTRAVASIDRLPVIRARTVVFPVID
jgi:homoserine dehydrogenase